METMQKINSGKNADLDGARKILDGLTVNKMHVPGYKRVKISCVN